MALVAGLEFKIKVQLRTIMLQLKRPEESAQLRLDQSEKNCPTMQ